MPARASPVRHLPGSPWVSLGGDALKALLSAPTLAKTAHFALQATPDRAVLQELPTEAAPDRTESVDNSVSITASALRLALVVPKRHAKRAATRNLIKRQMREAVRRRVDDWTGRQMLIRQRRAFDSKQYPSAASAALRAAVRSELESLFAQGTTAR